MNKEKLLGYKLKFKEDFVELKRKDLNSDDFYLLSEKISSNLELFEKDLQENILLELIAISLSDQINEESIEFFNLLEQIYEKKFKRVNSFKTKKINRNLSRIAKRRWIRYREKYKRVLKQAQDSFKNKPCQKNIEQLLKKENYEKSDVYCLQKAMNSSLTHFVIFNEQTEKDKTESLEKELLEEINALNYSLFKESQSLVEEPNNFQRNFKDLVLFANEIFRDCENFLEFTE